VSVEAFVPATISQSKLPDLCNTNAGINLTPYTLTNLGTWMGPGIAGTNFNPAVAGKGDFILTHTTASSPGGLCPDQATVAISVHSLAIPSITGVDRVCNNAAPVELSPTPVGGMFGGVNTEAIDQKGLFMPASAVIGNNIISYSITAGPCVAHAQTTVVVEKFVSADFAHYPGMFCRTNEAVNMNSYVQNPGGLWIGTGIVAGTSMFDPKLAAENNEITYITSSETRTLCPHTSKVRIEVNEVPSIQPVATPNQNCVPVKVELNIPTMNAGEAEWTLGDGTEPQKGLNVDHTYTSPGSYSMIVNYSFKGCSTQVAIANPIEVHEVPNADFTMPEEVLISNPEIQLTNLSTAMGNNRYYWNVSNVGNFDGLVNPTITLPKIGKYNITLIAETEHGCKDELTKTIEVKNHFNIFIPTSFTPNYDGLNDEFKPVFSEFGLDHRQYELEIFDRWGHSLFRSKDPNKGWDGSVQNKGEPLKEEVYVYRIKYKDMDGNAYSKMGHLSLVK
jgi:gliding motility-associated-like protein